MTPKKKTKPKEQWNFIQKKNNFKFRNDSKWKKQAIYHKEAASESWTQKSESDLEREFFINCE